MDIAKPEGIFPYQEPPLGQTFTISLSHDMAWVLRNKILPGPRIEGAPAFAFSQADDLIRDLRVKVNSAILRFRDEPDLGEVKLPLTEDEGWLIDQAIYFDGLTGPGTQLLLQVFRGLWGIEYNLPENLVEDPRGGWDNKVFRSLREGPPPRPPSPSTN